MRQGKLTARELSAKRMIIIVLLFAALCGHTGMAHDDPAGGWDLELHEVGGTGALIDSQVPVTKVCDAGGIRSPNFAGHRQDGDNLVLPFRGQAAAVVDQSK